MRARQTIAVLTAITVLGCHSLASAGAASEDVSLLALVNESRASAGRPRLSPDPALSSVAQWWAQNMARQGAISHNPDIAIEIANWSRLGENVGAGSSLRQVHDGLLASPEHYANIVNPDYSLVGIGVAVAGGRLYVVEDFGAPAGGRSAPLGDPEPPTTVVRPRPATTTPAADPVPPERAATRPALRAASPAPPPEPAATSRIGVMLDALRALDPGRRPR